MQLALIRCTRLIHDRPSLSRGGGGQKTAARDGRSEADRLPWSVRDGKGLHESWRRSLGFPVHQQGQIALCKGASVRDHGAHKASTRDTGMLLGGIVSGVLKRIASLARRPARVIAGRRMGREKSHRLQGVWLYRQGISGGVVRNCWRLHRLQVPLGCRVANGLQGIVSVARGSPELAGYRVGCKGIAGGSQGIVWLHGMPEKFVGGRLPGGEVSHQSPGIG